MKMKKMGQKEGSSKILLHRSATVWSCARDRNSEVGGALIKRQTTEEGRVWRTPGIE